MKFLKENDDWGPLLLRWGTALTLLFSVRTKFVDTERVSGLFEKVGLPSSGGFVLTIAVILAIVALMLILNWKVRIAGVFLTLFFAVTLILAFNTGPAVWKDFALLGVGLYFAFAPESDSGSGELKKDMS